MLRGKTVQIEARIAVNSQSISKIRNEKLSGSTFSCVFMNCSGALRVLVSRVDNNITQIFLIMKTNTLARPDSADVSLSVVPPSREVPAPAQEIRAGLFSEPRTLPAKYFYDSTGSTLFDRICDTPEYYLTRTEAVLLEEFSTSIIERAQPEQILELGSGTSRKTRYLLDACEVDGVRPDYAPFDVCEEVLIDTARSLSDEYDWLNVSPLVGDFTAGLQHLPGSEGQRLVAFLGSSIGNLEDHEAVDFLSDVRSRMDHRDYLLLGADRVKDHDILHAAYNDAQGLTRDFNLNILSVINDQLQANFDIDAYEHEAEFRPEKSRIEMHLRARSKQSIQFPELEMELVLEEGESLRTEISCKYTPESMEGILARSNLKIDQHYQDGDEFFSLFLCKPK